MAKTLIGNIKGKTGRGIASIKRTGTTGSVDTYTITYTDNTTSTFTINNSDSISIQRQIVPSAAVESSVTASQAYAAGAYVVVNGALRKVKSAIAKGDTIGDSNSTATTVTGEIAPVSLYKTKNWGVVRVGMTVYVRATMIIAGPADGIKCPYVIPEELRPSNAWSAAMTTEYGGADNSYRLLVMPDGTIKVQSMSGKTDQLNHFASLSYPIGM